MSGVFSNDMATKFFLNTICPVLVAFFLFVLFSPGMVWQTYTLDAEEIAEQEPGTHGRSHTTSDRNVWAHAAEFAAALLVAFILWGLLLRQFKLA
jgi:hypothetical protein